MGLHLRVSQSTLATAAGELSGLRRGGISAAARAEARARADAEAGESQAGLLWWLQRRLYAWRLVTLKGRTVGRAVGLGLPPTGVSAEVALVEWRARHARRMALRCAALGWAMVDLREARRSHLAAAQIARGCRRVGEPQAA